MTLVEGETGSVVEAGQGEAVVYLQHRQLGLEDLTIKILRVTDSPPP